MSSLAPVWRVLFFALIGAALAATDQLAGQLASATPQYATVADIGKDGRVVLRLPVQEAGTPRPFIAGDFTKWTPVRMKRHGDEWRFSVLLSGGVYRFAFR